MKYLFSVLLVLSSLNFLFTARPVTAEERVPLGIIIPLTGPVASMGQSIRGAFQTYEPARLTYRFEDDHCDAKKALAAYHKLSSEGVSIFYIACSGSLLAVAPVAKQRGHLIVSSYAGSTEIRKTGSEVIRFVPDALSVSEPLFKYLNEALGTAAQSKAAPFALLYEEKDYSSSLAALVREKFKDQIVFDDSYQSADPSFKTQLSRIIHSPAKSLIFIPVSDTATALIFKEMQMLGFSKFIIGEVNVCDYEIKPQNFGLHGVCFLATNTGDVYEDFKKNYALKTGKPSHYPFYDALTFDIAAVLDQFLRADGGAEKSKEGDLVKRLKKFILSGVQGPINKFRFTANGEVVGSEGFIQLVTF